MGWQRICQQNIYAGGGAKWLTYAPLVLVALLVLCTGYAGLISIRDTHTALFSPEYGWNAYGYNSQNITIQATDSLSDYLRDLVRDDKLLVRDHFDIYLGDESLVYFRESCDEGDMRRMKFRVVPENPFDLPGIRKNFGIHIMDFYPARQGAMLDGSCLAIAPLPEYEIDYLITGQFLTDTSETDREMLWETTVHNPRD